jgi:hypothetical protein
MQPLKKHEDEIQRVIGKKIFLSFLEGRNTKETGRFP